jgi:hypothetical protein
MSVESQPAAPDADVQPPEVTFSHGGPSAVLAALY